MDARTGRLIWRYPMRINTVDWSPDGRRLLGVGRSRLQVLERYGQHRVHRVQLPQRFRSRWRIEDAVFSPDGLQIAFTAYRLVGSDCGPVDPECIPYFADALFVVPGIGGSPRKLVDGDRDDYGDWPNSVSWQPIVE